MTTKQSTSRRTAIMGFGNPVRSDDAVGTYVIQQLVPSLSGREDVSLFDMGTSAFEVLFQLKGHQQIILIDAVVNSGDPVGTLYRLPAEEVRTAPQDDPMVFLHSIKWDQALSYAKKLLQDEYPEDIQVYLIAIEDTRLEVGMSEAVQQAGDRVVKHILEEVAWTPSP